MKKILSLLTISTLSSTLIPANFSLMLNTKYDSKPNNLSNIKTTSNPFINTVINDIKTKIIKIAPNGTIWVGSEKGLYKSNDGINFEKINGFNYVIYDIAFAPNGTVWISASGIYKSTDGTNFTKISGDVNGLKFEITTNGTIWLSNTLYHCLWKSTDGTNFSKITFTTSSKIYTIKYFMVSLDGTIYVVWQEFDDTLHFCKSTDGTNFIDILGINGTINDINFSSNGTIYVASTAGLYKSNDGINFEKLGLNDSFWNVKIAPNGTIWVGGLTSVYKSTDGTNFFTVSKDGNFVENLKFSFDGTIYSCNSIEVLKSTDGTTFTKIGNFGQDGIISIDIASDGTVYVGTRGTILKNGKLYKIDIVNTLLTMNRPDYIGNKYSGFIYKSEQNINIKADYLSNAILDGKVITIPATNIPLTIGAHSLILTLKNEYKSLSGNNTGQICFNFLIKTSINPISELIYTTNVNDTDFLSGLISNTGNTSNGAIIQTRAKQGTGSHSATINIKLNSDMFNLDESYYVLGIVDKNTNNFSETGTRIKKISKNLSINIDGTYHFHLIDVVGNTYDSYLELGQNNWKLQGTFNDNELNGLSTKLNVIVNLTDPTEKQQAMGWLQNYQSDADKNFNDSLISNGKGFNITINDLLHGYKDFLDSVTYTSPNSQEAINKNKLDQYISTIANKWLQDGLAELPQNLNIDTSNVVNKSTLDNYNNWIKNYQQFIKKNKDQWINDIVNAAARGFATSQQIQDIRNHLTSLDFSKFLKQIIWTPNSNLATSNDYSQFIEFEKLQTDAANWVNQNIPDINQAYQNAITQAESGLDLHGYTINQILGDRKSPQTKEEIASFEEGQSYHNWLQNEANNMFKTYQLKMGLGIGIPLALLTLSISIFLYWRFNKKNQPYNEKVNKD